MAKETISFYDYCQGNETTDLLSQWHPVRNAPVSPRDVLFGSHKKVWWRCEKGHEWQAQIRSRTNGYGCPFCTNRLVLAGETDLATTHPDLAAQWDLERNALLTPQAVSAGSKKKAWWRCEKGHEWSATIHSRASGKGCPFCAGKVVCVGENDLASQFPDVAAQWHPEMNGGLTPETVTAYSNRKVWWLCPLGHAYQAAVGARTCSKSGCPYCAGGKVWPGFNDLGTVHPEIAKQWHATLNGSLTPEHVTSGSNRSVWWECSLGHVWKARIFSRTSARKHGCPVCAGTVKRRGMQGEDEM